MTVQDRLSESASVTVGTKMSQLESDRLDLVVAKFVNEGKQVTRSSLIRAVLAEYLDQEVP